MFTKLKHLKDTERVFFEALSSKLSRLCCKKKKKNLNDLMF